MVCWLPPASDTVAKAPYWPGASPAPFALRVICDGVVPEIGLRVSQGAEEAAVHGISEPEILTIVAVWVEGGTPPNACTNCVTVGLTRSEPPLGWITAKTN